MDTRRRNLLKLSPLAIAAAATTVGRTALAESPAVAAAEGMFNVRTYGATGDGKTVDTPAVNRAIEAAAAKGGGMVLFPAGTYVCFTIHLRSNVDLCLSQGCTILAADSPKPHETTGYQGGTYDPAGPAQPWEAYQDYGHNHWPNSLFYGENIHDFSITGPGLIHGKGLSHGTATSRPGYTDFVAEQPGVGDKAIALKNCHNVLLRDFSVLHGGHFALLATGVDTLTLDNLLIDTERDGFDIDCCHNVRVSNCTVNSPNDDGICPKSSYALGYARTTENVTIANCFVTGAYVLGSLIDGTWKKSARGRGNGRIKCGTESNGGFRNIAISNCVLEGSEGIAIETADGALVEDIAISNITLRDTGDAPIFLRLNRRNRGPAETMRPGALRRVLISNLVSYNSSSIAAPILSGIPNNLIEDVKINNCYFANTGLPTTLGSGANVKPFPDWHTIQVPEIEEAYPDPRRFGPTPSKGLFIRHLKNLELSHVEFASSAPDPRPALWLEDVHRADFFAVTAPPQPNFVLRNVTDLRILWSRAAKDTTIEQAATQTV
ncbi:MULTISPECIES: glycoside hydrolase family 28 protein [Acidobacteriaceae]|uniref:rhamnogalacturonidase n=1 Tax=Acidobacteriaceae TaxID=204434 RepID=UPI00131C74ED|nr:MULTISPECIES: glycoside hydrolase family 28 protein [Acidobacteriaceae]MDW5267438.1 glycoside hydrolase family 28 protein [Edaphobacter sp.]